MNVDVYGLLDLSPEGMLEELVAVLGMRGSGKSNTAAVLMEELLRLELPIQVVDTRGEYFTLKEQFERVSIVGRGLFCKVDVGLHRENASQVAEAAYVHGMPTVVDLSGIPRHERGELLGMYFGRIWDLAAAHRIPTFVFLEEGHNLVPQVGKTAVSDLFVDFACEGRMHGLSAVLVTQRPARVDKNVLSQAGISFLHKVDLPQDMRVYRDKLNLPMRRVNDMVRRLKAGEVLIAQEGRAIQYTVRLRHTRHVGATPTLDKVPAPTQMSLLDLLGGGVG